MPSITMTNCPTCGCGGGGEGDWCVALVTAYGKNYYEEDSQFEERTEYAGISSQSSFQIGASVSEKTGAIYTGFHGLITEVQSISCYQNIVDANNALTQNNLYFEFE
ncbi:MAG: hypothetical protein Q4A17_03335 [Thermoguttaceae bacterium]|nr:hypothetical protein [Thermoguttaceae bacterium]